ncbi:MAG: hypothetical protein J0H74_22400 [Chitinophagaceae bacterium]|nr:hypothetical protein [Chitinophagaceae bacterium]
MKKSIAVDIISSLYVILFLYTGIFKLIDINGFRMALEKSPSLEGFVPFVSVAIPILEVLIGLSLLMPFFVYYPRSRKWGLYAGTVLMAAFTIYVGNMFRYSPRMPCTCGGIIQKMNWHQHFYFNILFTLLGLLAIWLNGRQSGTDTNKIAFSTR